MSLLFHQAARREVNQVNLRIAIAKYACKRVIRGIRRTFMIANHEVRMYMIMRSMKDL